MTTARDSGWSCLPRESVRRRCLFTTHTPVPAGHDQFFARDRVSRAVRSLRQGLATRLLCPAHAIGRFIGAGATEAQRDPPTPDPRAIEASAPRLGQRGFAARLPAAATHLNDRAADGPSRAADASATRDSAGGLPRFAVDAPLRATARQTQNRVRSSNPPTPTAKPIWLAASRILGPVRPSTHPPYGLTTALLSSRPTTESKAYSAATMMIVPAAPNAAATASVDAKCSPTSME